MTLFSKKTKFVTFLLDCICNISSDRFMILVLVLLISVQSFLLFLQVVLCKSVHIILMMKITLAGVSFWLYSGYLWLSHCPLSKAFLKSIDLFKVSSSVFLFVLRICRKVKTWSAQDFLFKNTHTKLPPLSARKNVIFLFHFNQHCWEL